MAKKVLIDFNLNQTSSIIDAASLEAHPAFDIIALNIYGANGGSSPIARFQDGFGSVVTDLNAGGTWTHYTDHYMQMNAVSLNSHGVKLLSGHYVNPLLRDAILSGSFNGRNTVQLENLVDGLAAQSAATVRQANTIASGLLTASGVILHGRLGGLNGDDHGLYPRLDGARAFTAPQAGVAPVGISDFCTKNYTDTQDLVVFNYFAANAQPTDATLTALAGLSTSANQLPYFTGTDAASVTPISASGRAVISGATMEEIRNTLDVRHIKRKVADESTSLNSGFLNDAELFIPVAANTNYSIRGRVFFDSAATPDFKWKIDGPASPTRIRSFYQYIANGAAGWTGVTIAQSYPLAQQLAGAGSAGLVDFEVMLNNGANSGFVVFQWAQVTSNVSSTTVHKGSYLEWEVRE